METLQLEQRSIPKEYVHVSCVLCEHEEAKHELLLLGQHFGFYCAFCVEETEHIDQKTLKAIAYA